MEGGGGGLAVMVREVGVCTLAFRTPPIRPSPALAPENGSKDVDALSRSAFRSIYNF